MGGGENLLVSMGGLTPVPGIVWGYRLNKGIGHTNDHESSTGTYKLYDSFAHCEILLMS